MVHGAKVIARRDVIGQLPTPGPLLTEQHGLLTEKYIPLANTTHTTGRRKLTTVANKGLQQPESQTVHCCYACLGALTSLYQWQW